jgi:hypothetical protein
VCVERSCKKHFKSDGYSNSYSPVRTTRAPLTLSEKKKKRAKDFKEQVARETAFEQLRALSAAANGAEIGIEDLRHVAWKMYERLWQDRKKEILKFLGLEARKTKSQWSVSIDCDKPVKEYLAAFTAQGQVLGFLLTIACFSDAMYLGGPANAYYEDKPDKDRYLAILKRLKVDVAGIEQRVTAAKDAERERLDLADEDRERRAKEKAAREKAALKKLPPLKDGELQTSAKSPTKKAEATSSVRTRASSAKGGATRTAPAKKPKAAKSGKTKAGRK